ncbi:Rho GTPase activation protein [Lactarius hengduanensis]|nr:Rho GTPase activation protein [Lactarius hengduanensis]
MNTNKIYSYCRPLRRRIECEKTFSFSSSDNIHSVAKLLELYLWDLPEPLIRLSLREFRQYGQNKAKYTEDDFSLLRSVIRELPPVHRETLGRLSRHLSRVASHSAQNGMPAKALASQFCYAVFRGNTIVEGYVYLKDSLMEDLIQNADTLFDEPSFSTLHYPQPLRGRELLLTAIARCLGAPCFQNHTSWVPSFRRLHDPLRPYFLRILLWTDTRYHHRGYPRACPRASSKAHFSHPLRTEEIYPSRSRS